METKVNIEVDLKEVWKEMSEKQRKEFMKWIISNDEDVNAIVDKYFSNHEIKEVVERNLEYVDEDKLIEELNNRGFIAIK